ncbi:MAG TPA: NAD-dependent epimerase/dehydratase family protein [Candidatus Tectomicrobia bacterium]|nr:NAD-dependent epimerase/dehydratase family protein [Candidatus Tectomicrobia bacterium]
MKCLVTGAAGFVGSHLAERLLRDGHAVTGIDCFVPYYPRWIKERNLAGLLPHPQFRFIEANLLDVDFPALLSQGIEGIFHQAAQAGVRASWGKEFADYTGLNILGTQQLLEAAKAHPLRKFVYASSSSVYGDVTTLPMREDALPRPLSPYGVSKLAAEHLCYLYWKNYGVPTIALRYFTVYGPRQRPDMAFHHFLRLLLEDRPIPVYGDGQQTRDFTFIDDIVEANLLALQAPAVGEAFNIGGGTTVTLQDAIGVCQEVSGKRAKLDIRPVERGDVRQTLADVSRAKEYLAYGPKVRLREGLEAEWRWVCELYNGREATGGSATQTSKTSP